jgi:hypothetical protein
MIAMSLLRKLDAAIEKQIAADGHVANAARMYHDKLVAAKDLFKLDLAEEAVVRDWLRRFAFSDGQFMFGHKLEDDEDWEDEAEVSVTFMECPTCGSACAMDGTILRMGADVLDEDEEKELEAEGYGLTMNDCPFCGSEMKETEVTATAGDMPLEMPGDIVGLLARSEVGGPYPTLAENTEFAESLRGGFPMVGAPEPFDTTDSRDPAKEGIWAEYLEPEGIWGFLELHLAEFANPWLNGEFGLSDEAGEALWHLAIAAHKDGEINVVALAVLADRLDISEEEMAATPVNFVSDGNTGDNLLQFVLDHPELDDVELDLPRDDWSPRFANEEQSVADNAAHEFEQTLFAHWTEMAGQRKLVLDEETGRPLWAACWKPEDVAYAKAQFFAILGGLSSKEARARGQAARLRHIAKGRVVTGVNDRGIVLSSGAKLTWVDAAQVAKLLKPAKGIVPQLRDMWVKLVDVRPSIAALGKALA